MKACYPFSAMAFLFVFLANSTQAANVNFRPTTVEGVSIVSAELVREVGSSAELLVVGFRNDGATTGQTVHLATSVIDASGYAEKGGCTQVEIQAAPGTEEVVSRRIEPSLAPDDSLTVELVDLSDENSTNSCPICEWCAHNAQTVCDPCGVGSMSCSCTSGQCSFECSDDCQ